MTIYRERAINTLDELRTLPYGTIIRSAYRVAVRDRDDYWLEVLSEYDNATADDLWWWHKEDGIVALLPIGATRICPTGLFAGTIAGPPSPTAYRYLTDWEDA